MFAQNLCDEVSKIKILRCTFSSFFHADHHEKLSVYVFHNSMIFENLSLSLAKISVMNFVKSKI